MVMLLGNQKQSGEDQHTVDHQQFKAKPITTQQMRLIKLNDGTQDRRADSDKWHQLVVQRARRHHPEGKQAQQRAIGITGQLQDQHDHAGAVGNFEQHHQHQEQRRKPQVHPAAQLDLARFGQVGAALHAQQVDAKARRQRRDGAVRAGKQRRDQGQQENDLQRGRHVAHHHGGKNLVARGGDAGQRRVQVQQAAQEHESRQHDRQHQRQAEQVFLRVAQGFHRDRLLHHFLVHARHRHDDENARNKLFPEEVGAVEVGGEHACQALRLHLREAFRHRHIQLAEQETDAGKQAHQHAGRLQRIGPDDGFHAALVGVQQDHAQDHHCAEPERHAQAVEDDGLQNIHDQVQPRRGTHQARQDEEPGSALVRPLAQAHVEVGINRGELQTVVQRQQDVRDGNVAEYIADQDLAIAKAVAPDRAGDADEGDAGQGRADHAERHQHPVRAFVTDEKTVVGGVAGRGPGHGEQEGKIADEDAEEKYWRHGCSMAE